MSSIYNQIVADHLEPVRLSLLEKVDRVVAGYIITPSEGDLALRVVIPLSQAFKLSAGIYQWEWVRFDFSITERWKVKKYGVPIVYQPALRELVNQQPKSAQKPPEHPTLFIQYRNVNMKYYIIYYVFFYYACATLIIEIS